jgi:hypothetical protein
MFRSRGKGKAERVKNPDKAHFPFGELGQVSEFWRREDQQSCCIHLWLLWKIDPAC